MSNLGNDLYRIVNGAKLVLFDQSELAQLTYGAFDIAARSMQESDQEKIEISFPVGYRADKTTIDSKRTYNKEDLLRRYQYLAFNQLSVNGVVQLVTTVEATLNDVVRATILKYPQKLGSKRSISMKDVLEAASMDEVHFRATDGLINELSYKSPTEFADAIKKIVPISLMECPAYHKYVEIKATRDIFIHNRGIANDVYTRKSGTHARVNAGVALPAGTQYYLESLESCLQMLEWLEKELHDHWHSSEFEERKNNKPETVQKNEETVADPV